MERIARIVGSSIGKKFIMAVTGIALILFIIGHLAGNLLVFAGQEAINEYAHFLQSHPKILWPARIGLLIMVGLHIWSAYRVWSENRAAKPVKYANALPFKASYASIYAMSSGLVILAFVIYHLLHFTVRVDAVNLTGKDFHALTDELGRHDVYNMMILGFSVPAVSIFYIIAMALLSFHLMHGATAMFQSIGIRNNQNQPFFDRAALGFAAAVFLGYISIPIAIILGIIS